MKVKKFVAINMTEAMKQIRQELGDEAVILNSKVIHSRGWLGLIKKKKLEVIAALDSENAQNQLIVKEKKQIAPINTPQETTGSKMKNDLHAEISELKRMVHHVSVNQAISYQNLPESIQIICENLREQEVDTEIISSLSSELLQKWRKSHVEPSFQQITEWGKHYLFNRLCHVAYGGFSFEKKFINLVGPTGVGKTTTLAKIAAGEVLEKRKKIAFITTDTYRIAAIEQLKTYANLLNVPVEVVYKLEDFQKAVEQYKEYDHIFIDTAGRNYREIKYINELQNLIDFKENMETLLTLSLSMKEKDIQIIIENFKSINFNKFIFTKLDETSTYGSIINLVIKNNKGVAYLTNGQDVPDDLVECNAQILINHLFAGINK